MKFERALKAMRRGETVRRRVDRHARYSMRDGRIVYWCGDRWEDFNASIDHHQLLANDWVIVRKKKKPEPKLDPPQCGDVVRYTGDQRVGVVMAVREDVILIVWEDVGASEWSMNLWNPEMITLVRKSDIPRGW